MIDTSIKKIYYNNPQMEVMYTDANTTAIIAGRRLGKSHGIIAPKWVKDFQRMPRSTNAVIAPTYLHAKSNTVPTTLAAIEKMGFKRDIHYFVGIKPPKKANFPDPYIRPEQYDNVISWYTGAIHKIISQDVTGSSNSNTFDSITCDEARFLNYDKLKDETFPANGGTKAHFGHLSHHHSQLFVSDMPHNKKGQWLLNYREKMDPEMIEAIHGIIHEIWALNQKVEIEVKLYGKASHKTYDNLCRLNRDLAQLRRLAIFYREYSSIDNLQILGESYIRQMKRDLPPIIFQTSILCKRIGILKDGFYHALNERIHYYTLNNNSHIGALADPMPSEMNSLIDADVNRSEPISIAFDYNANINWLVSGQPRNGELLILKSYFVKYNRKLRELVRDFCTYNAPQKNKKVVFYYDATAISNNYAVDGKHFAWVICDELYNLGWTVIPVYLGGTMKHEEKHLLINEGLRNESALLPRFNRENNEALILALEKTGVRIGSRGFAKDKSGEKLAESEDDKLEFRTDGTDAFDTLYIGCVKHPVIDENSHAWYSGMI